MSNQPTFADKYFDKLAVMSALYVVLGICVWFAFKLPGEQFKWAIGVFGLFFGLFSGLITGYAVGKGSNPPPPQPPLGASQTAPAPAPLPDPLLIAQSAPASTWTPAQPQIGPQK